MNLSYYQKVLQSDLRHSCHFIDWFTSRCDSRLEVMFGLALIEEYHANDPVAFLPAVDDRGAYLRFSEPFHFSPSGNGMSVACLMCQYPQAGRIWDFSIHLGDDNGYELDTCSLSYLLEIDGYGPHRSQRRKDEQKSLLPGVTVLRFPEERFKDIRQMARAALWSTVWSCYCGEEGARTGCTVCDDLIPRVVRFPGNEPDLPETQNAADF